MKSQNKTLLLALAVGLILPVASVDAAEEVQNDTVVESQVVVPIKAAVSEDAPVEAPSEEKEIEENKTIDPSSVDIDQLTNDINNTNEEIREIIGGEEDIEDIVIEDPRGIENISEQTIKFDGKAKKLDKVNIQIYIPCGADYDVISLKEYANAVKDTNLKFDFYEKDGKIYLSKGKNYTGPAYKKLSKDAVLERDYRGKLVVDGVESDVSISIINGEIFIDPSALDEALNFRGRKALDDSGDYLVNSDKSDIEVPSIEDFHKEIKKADYTVIFNWGPWCRDSRKEIPLLEEYARHLASFSKNKVQILGMIDRSDKYSKEDISVLFKNKTPMWKNFGTNEEIDQEIMKLMVKVYVKDLEMYVDIKDLDKVLNPDDPEYKAYEYGYYRNYPTSFIVDKNLKMQGKTFDDYYNEYLDLYVASQNMTRDDYNSKYIYGDRYGRDVEYRKDRSFDDNIRKIIYSNFLDYAVNGKKVSLKDANLIDSTNQANKPMPAKVNPNTPKTSSNPKTGIGSLTGVFGILIAAGFGLKKTKRD